MKLKIRECCCCWWLELTADCQSKANSAAAAAVFAATATRPAELHWQIAQYEHTKDYKSLCKRTNCSERARYVHRGHLSSLDVCHFLLSLLSLCCLHLPLLQSICINCEDYKVCSAFCSALFSLLFCSVLFPSSNTNSVALFLFLSQLMGQQTRCTSVPSPSSSFAFAPGPSISLTRWLLFSSFLLWPIIPLLDSSHCHKQPVNDTDCAVLCWLR